MLPPSDMIISFGPLQAKRFLSVLSIVFSSSSVGIDKLRHIYASAGLSIGPKAKISKIDALKEIIRAWGMNPEQVLARDALIDGAMVHKNPEDYQNHQLSVLSNQLKQLIRQEASV